MDTAVLDLPAPAAARLRRPGWRDPRLLTGVVLVAASVALGSWAVRSAQTTVPVYVASHALVPGQKVASADLTVAEVRLDGAELEHYLRADADLPPDPVVVRVVGDDELVPADAVGRAEDLSIRSVAVPLERTPSQDVVVGALVDLWFTPEPTDGDDAAGPPRQLAAGLPVAEVAHADRGLAASGGSSVHLLVPESKLADVLAALGSPGALDVVAVPGSGDR